MRNYYVFTMHVHTSLWMLRIILGSNSWQCCIRWIFTIRLKYGEGADGLDNYLIKFDIQCSHMLFLRHLWNWTSSIIIAYGRVWICDLGKTHCGFMNDSEKKSARSLLLFFDNQNHLKPTELLLKLLIRATAMYLRLRELSGGSVFVCSWSYDM